MGQLLGGTSQLPVAVLRVRGELQVLSPQDPSAFTSLATDLQEEQDPSAFEAWHRSETQTVPLRVDPVEQVGGRTQLPDERVYLVLGQLVQSPERELWVPQFLAGSTFWQVVPSKY